MSTVLRAHFQPVEVEIFRAKSLKKGKKLVQSFHVYNVAEERREHKILITGTVLRETPGAQSKRKHENLYHPIAQVNEKRKVIDTICNCKAGHGYCKHAAAICVYVNEENTRSKTDFPMLWNKPPEIQLEKYSKGCTIKKMRSKADDNDPLVPLQTFTFQEVQNTHELRDENCALSIIINAEFRSIDEAQRKAALKLQNETQLKQLISKLFEFTIRETLSEYHALMSTLDKNTLRVQISVMSCPQDFFSFYQQNIAIDENSWKQLCFESVKQSETAVWFKQRQLRITASTKAHRIKTRQSDFESLARQFIKTKYNGTLTHAMLYGLTNEFEAKKKFCEITGQEVHDVGLVIHPRQPFLACSPDGVICGCNGFELLEIKCPYTCKDTKIIESVHGKKCSNVNYLVFNEKEELELKPGHQYYTQVQLSLYVTGMKTCYFFVYSPVGHALVNIRRDEGFLALYIPKIENFYFKHFLPILHSLI